MSRLLLCLLLALAGVLTARAQPDPNRRLDSVRAALRAHPQADTNRVNTLNELARELRGRDPAAATRFATEGLATARQLRFTRGEAALHYQLGVLAAMGGQLPQALQRFTTSRDLWQQLHNETEMGAALGAMANVLVQQGQYEIATRYYLQSLRTAEARHDVAGQARGLLNLGNVYTRTHNFQKAIDYASQSLRLIDRKNNPGMYAGALRNIGQGYLNLNKPTQALPYLQQALALARVTDDKPNMSALLYTLGKVNVEGNRVAAALPQLLEARQLAEQLGDQQTLSQCLGALGDVARRQQQPAQAVQYYRQALAMAQENGATEDLMQLSAGLAAAQAGAGDFRGAYRSQQSFQQLADTLFSAQTARQVTELQTKYEADRKDARNRLQAAQLRTQQQVIRRRNAQLVAAGLGLLLLAGAGYLLYTRRRLRREVEFAQERQQLERLRAQAVLEAEETERRRIGADLHDGIGQLLTAARLNLGALGEQLPLATEGQRELLATAQEVVDESFREVRSISHNLMPNALVKRGLSQAVRDFLNQIAPDGHLRVEVQVVGLDQGPRLPPTVESVLFRVIQELVQNIVKHARATEITLQLIRGDDDLTVMVEDNGVGFDPAALPADAGIGLRNVETRLAYLGGRADFDAAPGRGTIVTLEVPL